MCWLAGFGGTILKDDPTFLCLDGSCGKKPPDNDKDKGALTGGPLSR